MKSIMVIAAVLAMPALAFGAASFTLTVGGTGTSGPTSMLVPAPGESFTLDIGIVHDLDGVSGFDFGLIASAPDIFTSISRTTHLSDLDLSVPTDVTLFNTTNAPMYTTALAQQNLGGIHSSSYWTGAPLDIVTVTVQFAPTATVGQCTISLGSPGASGLNILDQNYDFVTVGSAPVFTFYIPEPASMLLLAATMPLVCRRRWVSK